MEFDTRRSIVNGYSIAIASNYPEVWQSGYVHNQTSEPSTYARIEARMREKWPQQWKSRRQVPQQAIASLAGVKQPSVAKWKRGGPIDLTVLIRIAVKLDVCVEWLLSGRGPKFPTESSEPMIQELIRIATGLSDTQRMDLLKYARFLLSSSLDERRAAANK